MGFHITTRWGADESNPSIERMREVLAQRQIEDSEHPAVSLAHESEWCLGAYPDGLLIWENLELDGPRHMNEVSREKVLELWGKLSRGELGEIEREPWLSGYQDSE